MQNEMSSGPLLDDGGRLIQKGYATKLVRDYSRRAIKAGSLRIKEWDYYIVSNGSYAVSLTVADNSYMGLFSATLLDFANRRERSASVMTLLPCGKTALPETSASGDTVFKNDRVEFRFSVGGGNRLLSCRFEDFWDKKPFTCEFELEDRGDDSMVIATPFADAPRAFYYNQKINCMPARGRAELAGEVVEFSPSDSFGTLDWGRGVWTYSNTWYWGSASGLVDGKRFGFNIGYGFGDTSAASENMIFYDGKAHKLEQVAFNIPCADGRDDFLSPWTFTSSDGRFEMDFEPILDRASKTSVLVIESDQHQVFGRFNGTAVLDDGTKLIIKDLVGFAEKVKNRW